MFGLTLTKEILKMIRKIFALKKFIPQKKGAGYVLGEGREAHQRLDFQNELVKPQLIHALHTADTISSIKGATVVDFGCGASSIYETIHSFLGPKGVYIGIDASKEQIAFNKERFKDRRYILGGECSPEAEAAIASANFVYMRYVVMHQKYPKEFVHKIFNTLKPEAILIIQEPEDTVECKAEMVEKYPYSGEVCDFKSKIGEKLGLDYSFARNLESIFKELGPRKLIHTAEAIYIPLKEAKKFLDQGITEIAKKDKDKKLLTDRETAQYKEIISRLPEGEDDYWNLDFHHTFIVQKNK